MERDVLTRRDLTDWIGKHIFREGQQAVCKQNLENSEGRKKLTSHMYVSIYKPSSAD
jgi:hypothetical protein